MPKAEISWKRVTDQGEKLQVYVQRVKREWRFFHRGKRFDNWEPVAEPPLEDWLELLDAVQRLVNRRRYQPDDEVLLRRQIREHFPEADVGNGNGKDAVPASKKIISHSKIVGRRHAVPPKIILR
jgi:hypothetical protein